jgi:hypothetical protein
MTTKSIMLSGAAAFALASAFAPTTASALSVQFFEGGTLIGSASDTDNDDLLSSFVALSTGSVAANLSTVQNFPLQDQLLSTFNFSGLIANVVIQVTHNFNNGLPVPIAGLGSANNNFQQGAVATSEVFLGTSAFDMATSVVSATGSVTGTNTATSLVTNSNYWVTQVITVTSSPQGGTATTEWAAPAAVVPLPASMLLLGPVLAGLGFASRRKTKKA